MEQRATTTATNVQPVLSYVKLHFISLFISVLVCVCVCALCLRAHLRCATSHVRGAPVVYFYSKNRPKQRAAAASPVTCETRWRTANECTERTQPYHGLGNKERIICLYCWTEKPSFPFERWDQTFAVSQRERERERVNVKCGAKWNSDMFISLSLSLIWMWNGSLKYINFYNHGFLWKKMGVLLPRAVVRHGVFVHIIRMLLNVPSRRSSRSELPRVCAHIERSASLATATRQQNST